MLESNLGAILFYKSNTAAKYTEFYEQIKISHESCVYSLSHNSCFSLFLYISAWWWKNIVGTYLIFISLSTYAQFVIPDLTGSNFRLLHMTLYKYRNLLFLKDIYTYIHRSLEFGSSKQKLYNFNLRWYILIIREY